MVSNLIVGASLKTQQACVLMASLSSYYTMPFVAWLYQHALIGKATPKKALICAETDGHLSLAQNQESPAASLLIKTKDYSQVNMSNLRKRQGSPLSLSFMFRSLKPWACLGQTPHCHKHRRRLVASWVSFECRRAPGRSFELYWWLFKSEMDRLMSSTAKADSIQYAYPTDTLGVPRPP